MQARWRLGTVLVVLLIGAVLMQAGCAIVPAQQGDEEGNLENEGTATIAVTGTGEASVAPDQAAVVLGVETEADEAGAALNQNNQQMEAVIDALTEAGAADEDIQTEFFTLQPRYSQPREGTEPQLMGFTAIHLVRAQVSEVDAVGDLLDAAAEAGANRIDAIRFEVSDPGEQLEEARSAAWDDAQQKAAQLASLAGVELGRVMSISESSAVPRPVEAAVGRGGAAPIQPGQQDFQVQIDVRWSLQ